MEGFFSEELLRASLLVPKRKPEPTALPIQLLASTMENPLKRRLSVETLVGPPCSRLQELKMEYDTLRKQYEDASEVARSAQQAMHKIMDEILASTCESKLPTNLLSIQPSSLPSTSASILPSPPEKVDVEMLTNVSISSKTKFLPRKPRSLLFSRHHPDWMLTSTLDGSLQAWSLAPGKRSIELPSLHLPSQLNEACFAEDACVGLNGGCVAVVLGEPTSASVESTNNNLSGGHAPTNASIAHAAATGSSLSKKLVLIPLDEAGKLGIPQVITPSFSVHSKSIASIISYYDGPSDRSHFITGGNDRSLVLWDYLDPTSGGAVQVREIHRRHTSSIHSICQQVQSRTLWTGGADLRLVGFSMSKGQPVHEQKLDFRISHILSNQQSPNCLLIAQARQYDQLRIFDVRAPQASGPSFGWPESSNTSRYLKPSWHPAGNLIACGSSNPASKASGVNLWDVRYLAKSGSPLQMIELQAEKRYWSTEFHPTKDLLVALSTDGSISFLDFNLA